MDYGCANRNSEPDCVEDEHKLFDEFNSNIGHILATTVSPCRTEPAPQISVDEMVEEQLSVELCISIHKAIKTKIPSAFFEEGKNYVLLRHNGEEKQFVVRKSLSQRLLHMAHYSPPRGHPGGKKM